MKRAARVSTLVALLTLVGPTLGLVAIRPPAARAANQSADIDQCANGAVGGSHVDCVDNAWVNGNLGASKAHYSEGDSVPYRMQFGALSVGTHTVTIGWDVLQSSKHALDYLTSYNRTETNADPCHDIAGCNKLVSSTLAIPHDSAAPANQVAGVFTLFGATLQSSGAYTHNGDETTLTLTFTSAAITNPVLAWGGHIATRADWGTGNSAVAISGSPYHMRLKALDGSGGNQDRSLSSEAVIFPATITIVKVASPKSSQTFGFTAPAGTTPATFTLVDDGDPTPPVDRQTFNSITDFSTAKTFSENAQAGWALTGISCLGARTTPTVTGTSVSITPAEGEDITCTYTNVRNPTITALKTADPTSIDEPGGPVKFSVSVTNNSAVEAVTLVSLNDSPYGNIAAVGGKVLDTTCSVPQTIAANGTYTCSFHATVSGDANQIVTDVVTAGAKDLRGNPLSSSDDATVTVNDVKPMLQLDKTVSPSEVAEPGGNVTFKIVVTNPSKEPVTLTALTDDKFGSLAGKDSCSVPQTIAAGGSYSCTFGANVTGDPLTPHLDTVTGTAHDDENNEVKATGTATVKFTDVVPTIVVDKSASPSSIPEPGGKVTFTVVVTNPQGAAEHIKLTALNDNVYGNLDGLGTCDVSPPVDLAPGVNYTCSFDKDLVGNANTTHVDTVTATVKDDDGNTVTGQHDATVAFADVLPKIVVEKTAQPASVPEPGGDVTFGVKITNPQGAAEPVVIVSLVDDVFGDLTGKGSCLLSAPLVIAPGDSYSCTFPGHITGQPGDAKSDIITGKAKDDEGNIASDSAKATVTITDVLPTVVVDKSADPTTVPEPGGPVTFTVRVTNPGSAVEPTFLSELTDSVYGNLNGVGTCNLSPPVTLGIGKDYVCTFTKTVSGNAADVHTDRVTAAVTDDEKNRVTGSDDATVTLIDVLPSIVVAKAAAPEQLPEPGGTVTYTVTVTNTSVEPVQITSLVDAPFGDLAGKGTCLPGGAPVSVAVGMSYACSFDAPVPGDANSTHQDTVTATAVDDEKNQTTGKATATVTITDVKPAITVDKGAAPSDVAEPGGNVTFTVVVTNPASAVEPVALSSLVDSVYGDLNGQGTCDLTKATSIAIGGQYTCSFTKAVNGNAGSKHTDTVTAVAKDNEGNSSPPATDDATVNLLDVAPKIVVDKLASPSDLPEPGGTVSFTVTVTNPGTAESLTLSSLKDDVYGDLSAKGNCSTPQTIAAGGQYTCTFPGDVTGDASSQHTDTVTGTAKDDDGNTVTDAAKATVTIIDVKPTVLVTKSAAPTTLPEPGGTATFTVTATNPATAVEPIKLGSLIDSVYGSVNGIGTCDVSPPVELAPGASYSCSFPGKVAGNANSVHVDEVTATAQDNEENTAKATDKAQVTLTDVLPAIKVDKTASEVTVHAGDSVTYTYAVRNLGIEELRNVAVTDDKCSPLTLTGGDTDNDKLLDLTEVWTYTCTAKLTGATTNTATGTGQDDEGNTAKDVDTATVNVVNPKIVLDKVSNLTDVGVGDPVTYTYSVTNPGNAPLSDIAVTDDKCGPVTSTGGDTDNDKLLDPGEQWKFSCTTTLGSAGSITNTGTVHGKDPLGQDVSATDTAVVNVLETEVLPAKLELPNPVKVLPAIETLPAPQQTLPVTGGDILRWTTCGLCLIAGGSLLRRSRR